MVADEQTWTINEKLMQRKARLEFIILNPSHSKKTLNSVYAGITYLLPSKVSSAI